MPRKVNLSKTLKQDTKKVFEQIANFENYSKYIPGCSSARVLEKHKDYEVGELKFDFLLRKYSITSKNILLDNKIQIEQIEGPFEFFKGEWIINRTKDLSAEIIFNSEFKLPFLLYSREFTISPFILIKALIPVLALRAMNLLFSIARSRA